MTSTTPPLKSYGYLRQGTPKISDWHFTGDPAKTGGQSWCDFVVNPNGSVTCTPRGPYANLYFWAENPPLAFTPQVWTADFAVLVDDYSAVQAIEYDGQIQPPNWIYNFGVQGDREGSKEMRFFNYHPAHWEAFGAMNFSDFSPGKPYQLSAAFAIDMAVQHTVTLLGATTTATEYKPSLVHPAYFKQGTSAKWTKGGQIDFDGSGRGATFIIQRHETFIL
jgi:hypothetical protein